MHRHWIPFPSKRQIVETGVKDEDLCTSTGRLEKTRTVLAILRSNTVHDLNKKAVKEKDDIGYIKSNQYMTTGKKDFAKERYQRRNDQ